MIDFETQERISIYCSLQAAAQKIRPVGFKTQDQRKAALAELEAAPMDYDDNDNNLEPAQILRRHGTLRVIEAVSTYMGYTSEHILQQDKEHWLAHRLKAIKERYFAPL